MFSKQLNKSLCLKILKFLFVILIIFMGNMNTKLTALSSGGGCGCKVSPEILSDILGKIKNVNIIKVNQNTLFGIIKPKLIHKDFAA